MAALRRLVRWGLLAGRKAGRAASSRGFGESRSHRPGLWSSDLPPRPWRAVESGGWACWPEFAARSEVCNRVRSLCLRACASSPCSSGLPGCWPQISGWGAGREAVFISYPQRTGSALSLDRLVYLVRSWGSTWKKGRRLVRPEARVVCGPWPVARVRVHGMSRGHSGVALAGSWGFSEGSPDLPVVVHRVWVPTVWVTVD